MKSRRRLWTSLAALAAVLGVFLSVGAGSASAVISCRYDGSIGTMAVEAVAPDAGDDSVTLRKASGSPGAILVNGATCPRIDGVGVATVANVDRIEVDLDETNDDDGDTLTIDNRNGRVTEPGFTQNEATLNEIEFLLEDVESVVYEDTEATGAVTIGQYENGTDPTDAPPGAFFDIIDPATGLVDPTPDFILADETCGGGDAIDEFSTLINMNSFPGDTDADLAECDDDIDSVTVNLNGGNDSSPVRAATAPMRRSMSR